MDMDYKEIRENGVCVCVGGCDQNASYPHMKLIKNKINQ